MEHTGSSGLRSLVEVAVAHAGPSIHVGNLMFQSHHQLAVGPLHRATSSLSNLLK